MPTIVHFEIPSDDIERSRNFYSELFGWNIEKWTGSMPATTEGMEYWLLSTELLFYFRNPHLLQEVLLKIVFADNICLQMNADHSPKIR